MNSSKNQSYALTGVAQWFECQPMKPNGCGFNSQARAQAWVVGQVPSGWCVRGNHTLMFLSLSFSLPSPLSKNK